ncbi:MAG: DUF4230 domain-containing protein [Alloprevotella sp.]|nr:DUF4230 domain-containing protein [Alloprevotella sp.]
MAEQSSSSTSPTATRSRSGCFRWLLALLAIVLSGVALGLFFFKRVVSDNAPQANITNRSTTTISPTEVRHIQETGEWEFLSISTEELVENRRKHLTGDDVLACIYRGRLRIGTDLRQISPEDIVANGDTLHLRLPKVHLLSPNFIDEAQTKVFHETGQWEAQEKKALYEKARRQMMATSLTPENLTLAQKNGETQMLRFFAPFGFKAVRIEWK